MQEKILIFGNGQLGNFYLRTFKENNIPAEIATVDITDTAAVDTAIISYKPTVVINAAAKTNLEWCVNNQLQAFNVNVLGADNIAKSCDKNNVYFIHFSSGCIMESKNENDIKTELDLPSPISYYSWTKVWAEGLITFKKTPTFKYLILRPRQPVSAQVTYKNMLVKMLTFSKFIDTPNSGTVIEDLMTWTLQLIEKRCTGVLNVANEGWTTPYQIGLLLKKYILPNLEVNLITKDELNTLTPEKRVDTILDVTKLKSLVTEVKPYATRLEEIIPELGKNLKTVDKQFLKEQLEKTVASSKTRTVVNTVWDTLLQ